MPVSSIGVLELLLVAGSAEYRYLDKGRRREVDANERRAGVRKRSRELIKQHGHITMLEYILSVAFQVINGLRGSSNYPISMGSHAAGNETNPDFGLLSHMWLPVITYQPSGLVTKHRQTLVFS